ncbi:MAG: hypothetical protein U1F55_03260 [Chitinivorax sp.]|jgi:hypothetical protein
MKHMKMTLVSALLFSAQAFAGGVELFGLPLATAERAQMRAALKQNAVPALREDDMYWVDNYDPSQKLDEASRLSIGYEGKTSKFAYATYTFESFMDTDQVKRVVTRVSQKYGKPTRIGGSWELGPVKAIWNMPDNIEIEVSREWPSTTTLLTYTHRKHYQAMQTEIRTTQQSREREKTARQSNAF